MLEKSEQQNNIQESFDLSLIDSNLESIGVDWTELGIDALLKDGLLKDIPIVGTIANLSKVGANIHDRLFLKKILSFLNPLKDVSPEIRKKMIYDIDNSEKHRIKVGEKLLYIIDACCDYENSERVSFVFKAYLDNKITYDEFLKTASTLERLNKADFNWFVKLEQIYNFDLDRVGERINSGLFELHYEDISVDVRETESKMDWNGKGKKYGTDVDGGVSVQLSRAGEIILEIFCLTYKKPKSVRI